jgi:hypothetical protein
MEMNDVLQVVGRMAFDWQEEVTYDHFKNWFQIWVRSDNLYGTWQSIKRTLIDSESPGKEFSRAMVVTIAINEKLDEHLTLHHFDANELTNYDDRMNILKRLANGFYTDG